MLGSHLDVTVYGAIAGGRVFSGYITGRVYHGKSVYIVTRESPKEQFKGLIIAVLSVKENSEERLVVAPEGEFFYEPELRERLSSVSGIHIASLTCLFEKSCGALVIYRNGSVPEVLLVKNHNGKYWSFPKGHVEKGENERQTAIREIKEETGLDVTLYDNFCQISDYCPFGKIRKRVIFFLAESKSRHVIKQEDEIDSFCWAPIDEAISLCTYDNDLRVLKKAKKTLSMQDRKFKN